jgi:hypothetical protein
VHPSNKSFPIVSFAPPSQTGAHVIHLDLELFEGHAGFSLLGWIVVEFADDVAFFSKDFGEGIFEIDFGSRDELFAFVVASLCCEVSVVNYFKCVQHETCKQE